MSIVMYKGKKVLFFGDITPYSRNGELVTRVICYYFELRWCLINGNCLIDRIKVSKF